MGNIGIVAFDGVSAIFDWRWFSLVLNSWIFILGFVEWKIMVTRLGDHYQPGICGAFLDRYHLPGRTGDNPISLAHQSGSHNGRIALTLSDTKPETVPGIFR